MVNNNEEEPFWKRIALEDMTTEQWESLCDGCGRCCLIKLEDQDTGEVCLTRLACRLLESVPADVEMLSMDDPGLLSELDRRSADMEGMVLWSDLREEGL